MTRTSLIGAPLPRHDALGKVTGETRYPADLIQPDMLRLKVVFAGRPHASILSIDTARARAYPGVVAVLTAADVPGNAFGLIDADQPVLCADTVRFEGDKVAVVVAETDAAATAGAAFVDVNYRDLPPVIDPRAAMAPESRLVHADRTSNVLLHLPIRKGDITAGFAAADVILDGEFSTTWQEHAYLQPEAGIASIDDRGRVVIESAGQWLHEDRRQIAAVLDLPEERVIVRYAAIGGAFGGREDLSIQHLLALAAWTTQRPVAILWSREESMIGHHKRHPMQIRCRWGATRSGRITAVESEVLADGGAYASTSVEVLKVATLFANGSYDVPHIAADGYVVYTNNLPGGAFRGFGAPQSQFAAEIMVTRLAHAIGLDPIEMRRRNLYREGSIESTQHPLPPGVSARPVLERCVEEAEARFGPRPRGVAAPSPRPAADLAATPDDHAVQPPHPTNPTPRPAAHLRRGVGIACGMKNLGYSFGYPEQSTATIEIYGRGEPERAIVRIGAADVGQGSHLALRQIAAEEIGLPPDQIEMICDDSEIAPNAGSASASRLTLMAGRAVHDAAVAALERYRGSDDQRVEATAQYRPPVTTALSPTTGAGIPNYCYGYAAQAVEVEVNLLTGQVQVLTIISVHDVGRAINRQQVEGQIEGCLAQAIGYALLEDFRMRDGRVLTPFLSTYLLPTSLDVPPEIVPVILELADPNGPYGARGVAEMPLVPFTPAVAAAIHDATGIWLTEQPMTPERVLTALSQARRATRPVAAD